MDQKSLYDVDVSQFVHVRYCTHLVIFPSLSEFSALDNKVRLRYTL